MTPLDQLLANVTITRRTGNNIGITSIEYDSRRIIPGSLFVAMKGDVADGNRYIQQAIASGAAAIATDTASIFDSISVPAIEVPQGRRALSEISRAFYNYPDKHLGITGITGTNGKTTTANLLQQFLTSQSRQTILIGTIEYRIGDRILPSPHTTPESRDLLAIFAEGLTEGASEAVMEVSSHALEQGRVWQLDFNTAVFTNLTRDHLDYHGTMADYLLAKQRLFDGTNGQIPKTAIINSDDPSSAQIIAAAKQAGAHVLTFGIQSGDYRATTIALTAIGTRFTMQTPHGNFAMQSRLVGSINIYNLLAAAVAARSRGIDLDQVAIATKTLQAPPGRFQTIDCGQDFTVVVDYAHTDDALRSVTRLAREIVSANNGRVLTVFGCGGDRDTTKRPLMGKAAGEGSDVVIVTSDNPRSEDPGVIIEQILPGLSHTTAKVIVEPDRERAIDLALGEARTHDLVLIAGKGHEKTQTIGNTVFPFDDAAIARSILTNPAKRGLR